VIREFENCTAVVRDGLEYIYDVSQLGKETECSPQKESVCTGKIVYAEGYRNGQRYDFEGPVSKVYTNGIVLLQTGLWMLPIDATALKVQTESILTDLQQLEASVVAGGEERRSLPVKTMRELEPANPETAEKVRARRGLASPEAPK
jgi:hypothetical protein